MIDETLIEQLAQAVHENYLREQIDDGVALGSTPALRAWADLDDDRKNANRAQARDIAAKLRTVGGSVVEATDATEPDFNFTEAEIEELAKEEHGRWSAERAAAGWRHGARRDDTTKTHPSLTSWDDLPEAEKDKDRDAVRNIPKVLATVGLGVARA